MRRLRFWPLACGLLLAIVFSMTAARAQTARAADDLVPPRVAARTAAGDVVQVLVRVDVPVVPEGFLASAEEVTAQRDRLANAVSATMLEADAIGVEVGEAYEYVPYFRAEVTRQTLPALAQLAGVSAIEEVQYFRPALAQSAASVNAPAAWAAGATGAGWSVAILDTGVESTHTFLSGKVVSEACYSRSVAGFISLCPGGVASSTAPGSAVPCTFLTDCRHGTHVAGIAAGVNGPSASRGIGHGANIIAMQVYLQANFCGSAPTCFASSSADVVSALNRVFTLAGPGNVNRIAAVNLSMIGVNYTNQNTCDVENAAVKAAIDNLRSIGIATIAAAGNGSGGFGSTTAISAPACISTAVAVGASAKTDTMPRYGNRNAMVDLLAPGGEGTGSGAITSSVPGNTFAGISGTSMAAPHVAGAWAVLKQAVPGAPVGTVLVAMRNSGVAIPDPLQPSRSFPRLNVEGARAALLAASATPGPPVGFAASANGNAVTMNWAPPTTGGIPSSYTVLARLSPSGPVAVSLPVGDVTAFQVNAPNGVYYVSVQGSNAGGPGAESAVVTLNVPTLPPVPGAPTGLGTNLFGNQAAIFWDPPTTGGPVSSYLLLAATSPGGPPIATLPTTQVSLSVSNIPAGTFYLRVIALNAGGQSAPSNEAVLTVAGPAVPGAPAMNAPTVSGRTVNLSWIPGPGGTPTSFRVTAALTPGGPVVATLPVASTSVSVPNVASGTYYVRVTALNAVGASPISNEVTVVVP